jgi:hypothetical protein
MSLRKKKGSFVECLPDDLTLFIFGHLDLGDIFTVSTVSKNWNKLSKDNSLWKLLYDQHKWTVVIDDAIWREKYKGSYQIEVHRMRIHSSHLIL